MSAKPAIRSDIDIADIQAIAWSAFDSLKGARYMLLRIGDARAARQWLRGLTPTSIDNLYGGGVKQKLDDVIQIAFTAAGLRALRVGDDVMEKFSPEFAEGMTGSPNRSLRLGDIGANEPREWKWGFGDKEPHVLLILFAADDTHAEALAATQRAQAEEAGLTVVKVLTASNMRDKEPFGFADGISQPSFDWEVPRKPGTSADRDYTNLLALGELLLGYRNEYGLLSERPSVPASDANAGHLPEGVHPPDRRDLGRNGSYLVFRQLAQDVRGFWRWVAEEANRVGVDAEDLAASMVGRKRDGSPLADLTRGRSIRGTDARDGERNGFLYDTDPDGLSCPLGAHIRRANPRTGDAPGGRRGVIDNLLVTLGLTTRRTPRQPVASTLPWPLNTTIWPFVRLQDDAVASARFHRILRRGREYGVKLEVREAVDPAEDDPKTGIHFLCLNANIARQFEFIQGAWMASAKFAALTGEQDPLLGNRKEFPTSPIAPVPQKTDGFSRPGAPPNCKYSSGLPQFVTVRGGAYFFLPGLAALKWIASDKPRRESQPNRGSQG
jgi:deferrochelatase/peroxidase EfeB